MGASRKLQGEIDRVLKKVQEGVDLFDSIWNKVYDTDNANQKEKFEADLKKEIKKLQRYRDQIKTWMQSSEIKDKKISASYEQALMDARKQIERQMERFKICEKETKTKAFSKEGLGQQPKTDPKEKAKSDTRDWLNNVVSELENQIDIFEAELEGLTVKKGKTRPPRLVHLEASIVRHKAHIMKLELILRLLDNDELSPEQVNDVKDFLDDYVERNQEDFEDFDDVDELYSSLPLDKVDSLEELVTIGPPVLVKGLTAASATSSLKTSIAASPGQVLGTITSSVEQGGPSQEQPEETAAESVSENVPRTPPPKTSVASSAPTTPSGSHTTPTSGAVISLSPRNLSSATKDEEVPSFPDRKSSPAISETGLKNVARTGLPIPTQSSSSPFSTNGASSSTPTTTETTRRNIFGTDERPGSGGGGAGQPPLASPMANRTIPLTQTAKSSDGMGSTESESNIMSSGRVFSPSSGMQWRSGTSFQNINELGPFRGRTEIAPDQREKFLQRFHQAQQGLSVPSLSGGNHKQNPLLTQFTPPSPQHGLGAVAQAASSSLTTQHNLISTAPEGSHSKAEEMNQPEESGESSGKNEDDLRALVSDAPEQSKIPRDSSDFSPGQPLQMSQPPGNPGVIGRRTVSDLGIIGDSLSSSSSPSSSVGMYDQLYNLQMLEAAFHKLPQPRDSERLKSYTPKHPVLTPPSYPQVQAPIVNNPAFWERLGADSFGTDTLFFAFYYQQNTYQQYLAAKELKKQNWRYHRRFNTWFQRHEEPKIATDDYEKGTYVYFDFHLGNDEQHGWCQRIKTDFAFEYNYLEDDLMI